MRMTAEQARTSIATAKRSLEAAADEIVRQINGHAWFALGYECWDEMRQAEYGGAAIIVPRADRPELVARLRREGLSQQQVGETVGVSTQTVSNDVSNFGYVDLPATRTDALGREQPTRKPRTRYDRADHVTGLVAEFPELEHYADRPDHVVRLGEALRGYDEPERSMRREALSKSIAADQRRATEPEPEKTPDYYRLAQDMFFAANEASQVINRSGGADTFTEAVTSADPLEIKNWENQFAELAMTCRQVASACRPSLRSIK